MLQYVGAGAHPSAGPTPGIETLEGVRPQPMARRSRPRHVERAQRARRFEPLRARRGPGVGLALPQPGPGPSRRRGGDGASPSSTTSCSASRRSTTTSPAASGGPAAAAPARRGSSRSRATGWARRGRHGCTSRSTRTPRCTTASVADVLSDAGASDVARRVRRRLVAAARAAPGNEGPLVEPPPAGAVVLAVLHGDDRRLLRAEDRPPVRAWQVTAAVQRRPGRSACTGPARTLRRASPRPALAGLQRAAARDRRADRRQSHGVQQSVDDTSVHGVLDGCPSYPTVSMAHPDNRKTGRAGSARREPPRRRRNGRRGLGGARAGSPGGRDGPGTADNVAAPVT